MTEKRITEASLTELRVDPGPGALSEASDPVRQGRDNSIALAVFDEQGNPRAEDRLRAEIAAVTRAFRDRNRDGAKTLYFWYDAQAGQLRASAVHAGQALPFACVVNQQAGLDAVIADTRAGLASLAAVGRLAVYVVGLEGADASGPPGR